jgi:hypothetical protein
MRFGNDTFKDEPFNVMTSRVVDMLGLHALGRVWPVLFSGRIDPSQVSIGHWEVEARHNKIQRLIIGLHFIGS